MTTALQLESFKDFLYFLHKNLVKHLTDVGTRFSTCDQRKSHTLIDNKIILTTVSICGISYERLPQYSIITIWIYPHPIESERLKFIESQAVCLLQKLQELTRSSEFLLSFLLIENSCNSVHIVNIKR